MVKRSRRISVLAVAVVAIVVLIAGSTIIRPLDAQATSVGYYSMSSGSLGALWHCIDGAVATADGYWLDTHGFSELSIQVDGITTATVQVRGSNNAINKPADSADEYQLGSDITADGITTVTAVPYYTKIIISAYTSGTIHVYVYGKGF